MRTGVELACFFGCFHASGAQLGRIGAHPRRDPVYHLLMHRILVKLMVLPGLLMLLGCTQQRPSVYPPVAIVYQPFVDPQSSSPNALPPMANLGFGREADQIYLAQQMNDRDRLRGAFVGYRSEETVFYNTYQYDDEHLYDNNRTWQNVGFTVRSGTWVR